MKRFTSRFFVLSFGLMLFITLPVISQPSANSSEDEAIYLMIRADDMGMSHSVNMALKELLEAGYPASVSVMFASPWWKETVAILKEYDDVSIGIHLTLNSEWENYRWGPITGIEAVPALVDEEGYFYHTTEPLKENPPPKEEMEKELRAQIERARATGLRIDYVDNHMGIGGIPGFREVVDKLTEEYGIAKWGQYRTPRWASQYAAHPNDKADSLVTMVNQFEPGYNYIMAHIGIDDSELRAMKDMNASGSLSVEMSAHRQGELTGLTSDAFAKALKERNVRLVTFKDLMDAKEIEETEQGVD